MTKNANEYDVTQPYGYDPSYPLNNGFHRGIDYGAPEGTPLVINGIRVALTGSTGAATGPHLHLGKWQGNTVLDPGNGGFNFDNAVVAKVGYDNTNGNYIKINADGYTWIYCHLSQVLVNEGQELKGAKMYPTKGALQLAANQTGFGKGGDGNLEPNFVSYWTTGTGNPDWSDPSVVLAKLLIEAYYAGRKEGQTMQDKAEYVPVTEQLYKKKG